MYHWRSFEGAWAKIFHIRKRAHLALFKGMGAIQSFLCGDSNENRRAPFNGQTPSITFTEPWGEKSWRVEHNVTYSNKRPPHVECVGANVKPGQTANLSNLRQQGQAYMWTVDGVKNGKGPAHFTVAFKSGHPIASYG